MHLSIHFLLYNFYVMFLNLFLLIMVSVNVLYILIKNVNVLLMLLNLENFEIEYLFIIILHIF